MNKLKTQLNRLGLGLGWVRSQFVDGILSHLWMKSFQLEGEILSH